MAADVAEGADMLLVKPALPSLDILAARPRPLRRPDRRLPGERRVRPDRGRRASAAGSTGRRTQLEALTSIVRAGASLRHHLRRRRRRGLAPGGEPMTASDQPPRRATAAARPTSARAPRTSSRAASTAPSGPSARSAGRRSSSTPATGPRVRDADGRWYLDYIGSWGPAILGHAAPGGRSRPSARRRSTASRSAPPARARSSSAS